MNMNIQFCRLGDIPLLIIKLDKVKEWKKWCIEINNVVDKICTTDNREYCDYRGRKHNDIYAFQIDTKKKYFIKETYYLEDNEVMFHENLDGNDFTEKRQKEIKNLFKFFHNSSEEANASEEEEDNASEEEEEEEEEIIINNNSNDYDRSDNLPFEVDYDKKGG